METCRMCKYELPFESYRLTHTYDQNYIPRRGWSMMPIVYDIDDWQTSSHCCLWSLLSCFGTHQTVTLRNFRCSRIIFSTELTLRLNSATISWTVRCLSSRMQFSTLLMSSAVIAVHGTPMRTSSPTDWRLSRKPVHHSNTRERDKQSSLNTAASLWWISALETLSTTRNLIIICCCCCAHTSVKWLWAGASKTYR